MERWSIRLLGDLSAERAGQVVRSFGTQKAGLLLGYLAYYPDRRHAREVLADLLWPESDPEAARTNLRVALHAIRQRLEIGESDRGRLVLSDKASVQIAPDAVWTDARAFEQACDAVTTLSDDPLGALTRALDLYGGDFLPGAYDPWALEIRERLAERYYFLLKEAIRLALQSARLADAMNFAHRAISLDPLREEANLEVMRLYVMSGRPSAAVRQFRTLQAALQAELGVKPSAETLQAVRSLLHRGSAGVAGGDMEGEREEGLLSPCRPDLPLDLSRFFGRETELAWLAATFDEDVRLATITGPPGCGKTRLAVEYGRRQVLPRAGAVWFIPLAPIGTGEAGELYRRIRAAVSQSGLPGGRKRDEQEAEHALDSDRAILEDIADLLGARNALLILDNAEHLLPELTESILALLSRLPAVSCLVTSRQRIDARGEREYPLTPLPVPPSASTPAELGTVPSVSLFVDRARTVRPDFRLSAANAAAVCDICSATDGLPLAIELAAAWVRSLSPRQIRQRMDRRFELLVARDRDQPPHHRTLAEAIGWSVDLLPPNLRRAFCAFSVFRGGWTLEAAQALLDSFPEAVPEWEDALTVLDELRSRSLVVVEELGEHSRFRFYESLREYAAEAIRSGAEGLDENGLSAWHLEYYADLSERSDAELEGSRQLEWLARLTEESDNLEAALRWSESSDPLTGLRLACGLFHFWVMRNRTREGAVWLDRLIAPFAAVEEPFRANLGASAADGEPVVGEAAGTLLARAHTLRGRFAELHGEYGAAIAHQDLAVAMCRHWGDIGGEARALAFLGSAHNRAYAHEDARRHIEAALALFRALDNQASVAEALGYLGVVAGMVGDVARAEACFRECRAIAERLGDRWRLCSAVMNLGEMARLTGRPDEALEHFREGLRAAYLLGDMKRISDAVRAIAIVGIDAGDIRGGGRLFISAQRIFERSGERLQPHSEEDVAQTMARLREVLGPDDFGTMDDEMSKLEIAAIVDVALR